MMPDRFTLALACVIAAAGLVDAPMWILHGLGVTYSVHALRSFRRATAIPVARRYRRTIA